MKKEYVEIPQAKFVEGVDKIKGNIVSFLESAEILLKHNKLDHSAILAEFAIEELGKILMLQDEYHNTLSDPVKVPKPILRSHRGKSDRAWQYLNRDFKMSSMGGFERSDDGTIGFEQVTFSSHNTRLECAFVDFANSNRWYVGRNIDPLQLQKQIDHIREKTSSITK